ncbi:MAG: hypothetical protein MJ063_06305 [Lachnospiraceae bacterium]|nr:hypothetical protein [Lachnospiraceae bacterium]
MGVFFKGFFRVIIDAEKAEVIRKEMHARFLCLFQVEARAAAWVKQGGHRFVRQHLLAERTEKRNRLFGLS